MKNDIPVAGAPTRPAPCGSGTTRRHSVLDTNCKAHEVDNLYVVDTSFFPSIGAVNPALTAIANASARRGPPARAAQVRSPLQRHAQVGHHLDNRAPGRDAELAIDRLHLRLYGVGRDIESFSDLRERQMGGE